MAVVGTAYVIVKAITKGLSDDIGKQIEKSDIGDKIGDSVSKSVKKKGAGKRIGEDLASDIGKGTDSNKSRGFLRRSLDRLFSRAGGGNNNKNGRNIGERFAKSIGQGFNDFKVPLPVLLGVLGLPAIGGILKILGSYVGAATSLLSALGPAAAGAGLGFAALYAAAGQVFGVMKLIFSLKTETLKRFQTAIKAIGNEWKGVGEAIQKEALPAIAGAFQRISDELIPAIGGSLVRTGSVVGGIARQFAALTATPLFQSRLKSIVDGNNIALGHFGTGAVSVIDSLVTLLKAANPLLITFSKFFESHAAGLAQFLDQAERTGKLAAFVKTAQSTLSQLGRITGSVFGGLAGIFRAAYGPGLTLLDSIERLADKFDRVANSAKGQNTLRQFFKNALPVVHEFNGIIGDLFKLLGKSLVTNNSGTVQFLQLVRAQLIPAVAQLTSGLSTLGPSLIALSGSFATLLQAMANSGALGAFTKTLTILLDVLTTLFSTPVVGQILGFAVSVLAVGKAINFVLKPVGGLVKILPLLIRGITLLGQAVLAAFEFNPIILIITAVVAAIVLLYLKSETFRKIVATVWAAIKDAAVVLWHALQAAWDAIVTGFGNVVSFFQGIGATFAAIWSGFMAAIQPFVNFIRTVVLIYLKLLEIEFKVLAIPIKIAIGIIILAFRLMKAIVTPILRQFIDSIRATFGPIREIISVGIRALGALVGPPFRAIRDIIKGVLHDIRFAVSLTFQVLNKAFTVGFAAIKTIVSTGWDFVQSAGEGVAGAIKVVLNGIIGAINTVIGGLNAVIRTANRLPGPDIGTIGKLPQLASGAIIRRRSGGTDVTVGEGNNDEAVLPLNRRTLRAAGLGGVTVEAGAVVIDARGAHPAMAPMIQEQIDEAFDKLYQRLRTA